jgi:hypothetical protein
MPTVGQVITTPYGYYKWTGTSWVQSSQAPVTPTVRYTPAYRPPEAVRYTGQTTAPAKPKAQAREVISPALREPIAPKPIIAPTTPGQQIASGFRQVFGTIGGGIAGGAGSVYAGISGNRPITYGELMASVAEGARQGRQAQVGAKSPPVPVSRTGLLPPVPVTKVSEVPIVRLTSGGIQAPRAPGPETPLLQSPDVAIQAGSIYTGPTGQVGPNEFVVTDLSDVGLIARQVPGANIFYHDPNVPGPLRAVSGLAAYQPALLQYLLGHDLPQSVIDTLVRMGLLEGEGAGLFPLPPEGIAGGVSAGTGGGVVYRTPVGTGTPSSRALSVGLVNWRI